MDSLTRQPDAPLQNPKDEQFVLSYLTLFDAGKAYLACTPNGNPKTARQQGYKLLQRPEVRARLQFLAGQKLESANAQADRLIAELERIAFLDPIEFMEVDAEGEPVLDLTAITPENRRLLKVKFGIGVSKDGDRIRTYQVEPHDKMEAMEKLLKLHQLYKGEDLQKQPMAIQVNVNIPIPGQSWRRNQASEPEPIEADAD